MQTSTLETMEVDIFRAGGVEQDGLPIELAL